MRPHDCLTLATVRVNGWKVWVSGGVVGGLVGGEMVNGSSPARVP